MQKMIGGIEAGGSKFVCAVGTSPVDISDKITVPTTTPDETLEKVVGFFKKHSPLAALGIGSFGPLDLDRSSETYGFITSTPKSAWRGTNLLGSLKTALGTPIHLNTDVNAAALSEKTYGAGKGLKNIVYVTVGTGIGAGCIINDELVEGPTNTEIGHILIPRLAGDTAPSSCSYHESCFEGLASASALKLRYGIPADQITDTSAWDTQARYLGEGLANIILSFSPDLIILGGGVLGRHGLIEDARDNTQRYLNNYVRPPELDNYIVPPELGNLSGITGALILAQSA